MLDQPCNTRMKASMLGILCQWIFCVRCKIMLSPLVKHPSILFVWIEDSEMTVVRSWPQTSSKHMLRMVCLRSFRPKSLHSCQVSLPHSSFISWAKKNMTLSCCIVLDLCGYADGAGYTQNSEVGVTNNFSRPFFSFPPLVTIINFSYLYYEQCC